MNFKKTHDQKLVFFQNVEPCFIGHSEMLLRLKVVSVKFLSMFPKKLAEFKVFHYGMISILEQFSFPHYIYFFAINYDECLPSTKFV